MTPILEFDHLFIFTTPAAPEVEAVLASGLTEGSSRTHPGQGTANRRIFFRNAMVEFLWVCDRTETQTPAIQPMQFLARSHYRQSGYSPFGLGLRYSPAALGKSRALPFDTWAYRPPYLPANLQFEIAPTQPHEPLIFVMPFEGTRPDTLPPEHRPPLEHTSGMKQITGVHITIPGTALLSDALQTLQATGLATFTHGSDHLVEVTFDQAAQGKAADFRPPLPLQFHY